MANNEGELVEPAAALAAALPTEIVQTILIAGVRDKYSGKLFGARCLRVAKWVVPCIIAELYFTVDLWTESQATSFLSAIQSNEAFTSCRPRHYVQSIIIHTAAFNAHDTQHVQSILPPQMDVGRLTPGGGDCTRWKAVSAPMVILATRRHPPPPIIMPRHVTITGVDSLSWGAYSWSNVERLRFTSYNPNLQETRWLAALPLLSHVAFAFYYDIPLGITIVEELASSDRIQCILVVVYYPRSREDLGVKENMKKSLQKLDEPKLVIWEDTTDLVDMLETDKVDWLWKNVELIVQVQVSEKETALLQ